MLLAPGGAREGDVALKVPRELPVGGGGARVAAVADLGEDHDARLRREKGARRGAEGRIEAGPGGVEVSCTMVQFLPREKHSSAAPQTKRAGARRKGPPGPGRPATPHLAPCRGSP